MITNHIHGHASTYNPSPTYITWRSMIVRCYTVDDKDFPNYGGRGITVCDKWQDFEGFLEDMGERPKGMTLDRKDNNDNYNKDNCRWASRETQARNRNNTYLSLEIAAEIVLAKRQNKTYAEVGRMFDITGQQVRHICLGNAWKGAIELADKLIGEK